MEHHAEMSRLLKGGETPPFNQMEKQQNPELAGRNDRNMFAVKQ